MLCTVDTHFEDRELVVGDQVAEAAWVPAGHAVGTVTIFLTLAGTWHIKHKLK